MSAGKDVRGWVQDRASFEKWREDDRNPVESERQSVELFASLLLFLADGYSSGNLAQRAAAVLLLASPNVFLGANYAGIAQQLGVSEASLVRCMVLIRQELPFFNGGGFAAPKTSAQRRVSIAQIRNRRRELRLLEIEAEAKERARLRTLRVSARLSLEERRRLAVARRTLAAAVPLLKRAAEDMAEFDRKMGLA